MKSTRLVTTLSLAALSMVAGSCSTVDHEPIATATPAPAAAPSRAASPFNSTMTLSANGEASTLPTTSENEARIAPARNAASVMVAAASAGADTNQRAAGGDRAEAAEPEAPTLNASRVTFAEEGSDFDPCASPDGKGLVFASTQHRKTSDLYYKRTDSRVVTQLTNDPADDAMPRFSPDGSRIAFASNRAGNWDVYVMPASGGKAVQITSESTDEIAPTWSSDGQRLAFCRQSASSGRWEMWVTEVANPSTPHFVGEGLFPQWCPVAMGGNAPERLLYQVPRERGRHSFALWTLELADGKATNATEIVSSATSAFIDPAWSPDGRWIVFSEVPVTDSVHPLASLPEASTLWMIGADGEGRVRLTTGVGRALSPTWSGQNRLFFVSNRAGNDNVWALDMDGAIRAASVVVSGGPTVSASSEGAFSKRKGEGSKVNSADNRPVANVDEHVEHVEPTPH